LIEEKKMLPNPEAIAIRTLQSEKAILEKQIADIQEQKHLTLVSEIAEARLQVGMIKKEQVGSETERLLKLPDAALQIMKEDTRKVIEKLASRRHLYR